MDSAGKDGAGTPTRAARTTRSTRPSSSHQSHQPDWTLTLTPCVFLHPLELARRPLVDCHQRDVNSCSRAIAQRTSAGRHSVDQSMPAPLGFRDVPTAGPGPASLSASHHGQNERSQMVSALRLVLLWCAMGRRRRSSGVEGSCAVCLVLSWGVGRYGTEAGQPRRLIRKRGRRR